MAKNSQTQRRKTKIATVVGARPQFVKAASVSRVLRKRSDVAELLIHTGQHFDQGMSDVFFSELEIPIPSYHLGINSLSHGAMTGRMIEAIEHVMIAEKPDWLLVYGDTNSTLAGALAAAKLHIPVAHVEAGLRSYNRDMPEELNRVLTDHLADVHFAPTTTAVENLRNEGIRDEKVHLVGDVMFDVALYFSEKAERFSRILERFNITRNNYVLATVHRAENTDDDERLAAVFEGLIEAAKIEPVVLPLHPRTRNALERVNLLDVVFKNLIVSPPVGYLDMLMLEKHARCIVTDSGGVQKEAFFCGVPCVTLRDETEWIELLHMNWNTLVSPLSIDAIVHAIANARTPALAAKVEHPYGLGNSAELIAKVLLGD